MIKYVRLVSYENACKIVDFVNNNDKKDYANITTGGIQMEIDEKNLNIIVDFIKSLDIFYEICNVSPYIVKQQIVDDLKSRGIIK